MAVHLYIKFNIRFCQATLLKMQLRNQAFTIDLNKTGLTNSENDIVSAERMNELSLISQYLELKEEGPQCGHHLSQEKEEKYNILAQTDAADSIANSRYDSSTSSIKKTSIFHNFQKHLIITLKKSIKLKNIKPHFRSQSIIANQIWQYFCSASKTSKKFLHSLLNSTKSKNVHLKDYKYYDQDKSFLREFSEYSEQQMKGAQEYLCKEIVRQCRKIIQSNQFENRRIGKQVQFKQYLSQFIDELQDGKISKRLPKRNKNNQKKMIQNK